MKIKLNEIKIKRHTSRSNLKLSQKHATTYISLSIITMKWTIQKEPHGESLQMVYSQKIHWFKNSPGSLNAFKTHRQ